MLRLQRIILALALAASTAVEAQPSPYSSPLVNIPAGSFQRGDSNDGNRNNDAPISLVQVSAFNIESQLVTYQLWTNVYQWAINNGYTFSSAGAAFGANNPVESVTWFDVVKWCNARSQMESTLENPIRPCYYTDNLQTVYTNGNFYLSTNNVDWTANGYRLPTEAEWEKAARGGLTGQRFPYGDTISHSQATYVSPLDPSSYDLGPVSMGGSSSSSVGMWPANGYGLYDMAGNMSEWCWDYYSSTYYNAPSSTNDPRGPASGGTRIWRGGSWDDFAPLLRCAYRGSMVASLTRNLIGFRCVQVNSAIVPTQSQSIDFDPGNNLTNLTVGDSIPLIATNSPLETPVSFQITASTPPGIASIDGNNNLLVNAAGMVTVTASVTATNVNGTNYLLDNTALTFWITGGASGDPASNTITFNPAPNLNPVYGTTNPLTATSLGGTPVTLLVTASTPANIATISQKTNLVVKGVGNFTVTAQVPAVTNSGIAYASNSVSLNFISSPAVLTVTASSTNRIFGAPNPAFTWTPSGFVKGDTANVLNGQPSLSTLATTASLPANYTITIGQNTLTAANYTFNFINGTLTVFPKTNAQTIKFVSALNTTNPIYGTNITLTATSSVGAPVTEFVITRSTPTNIATISDKNLRVNGVGSFTVAASVPAGASNDGSTNYSAATTNLNFTSIKARLTVTANNTNRLQGTANPAFTVSYSGFVTPDGPNVLKNAPSLTTTALTSSPVGNYPITVSQGTLSATNYAFFFVSGTLTVYTNPPVLSLAKLAAFLGTSQLDTNELKYILTNNYARPINADPQTLADFLGSSNIYSVDQNDLNLFLTYNHSSGSSVAKALVGALGPTTDSVDQPTLNAVLAHYWGGNPPYITNPSLSGTSFVYALTNFTFLVQVNTNLAAPNWQNIGQAMFQFTDTNAVANQNGFYRIISLTNSP